MYIVMQLRKDIWKLFFSFKLAYLEKKLNKAKLASGVSEESFAFLTTKYD